MELHTTLHTRDGRRIGNAIILSSESHDTLGTVYLVQTDFGNRATLTEGEIHSLFWIGEVRNIEERKRDQARLLCPELDYSELPEMPQVSPQAASCLGCHGMDGMPERPDIDESAQRLAAHLFGSAGLAGSASLGGSGGSNPGSVLALRPGAMGGAFGRFQVSITGPWQGKAFDRWEGRRIDWQFRAGKPAQVSLDA